MNKALSPLTLSLLPLMGVSSMAAATAPNQDPIERIQVLGHQTRNISSVTPEASVPTTDISSLLTKLPGAAVNANGPVSAIAQYRGLFGDRVNTKVNGLAMAGAGPNAMDTPLSYASQILTEQVEVSRGIAPVSSGINSLGGNIQVIESQPKFDESSALIRGHYQANGDRSYLGAKANLGSNDHAMLVYVDKLDGSNNPETGDGREISPGEYDKLIIGGQYSYALDPIYGDVITLGYQHLETKDSGTSALPMDIDYIRTDRIKLSGKHSIHDWQLDWHLAYSDARHGMDNYSLRHKMPSMSARYNTADSESYSAAIALQKLAWSMGLDWYSAEHNSVITDPNNPMFRVDNFNQVKDTQLSAYLEWQQNIKAWHWQLGARVKHYMADADTVSHSGAMKMAAIKNLMDAFNQADRNQSQTGVDLVANGQYQFSDQLTGIIGVGIKQSPASYQQRYLWVPMQSTGGLADGKTYVGQIDLDLETAYQLELGLDYQYQGLSISPRLFLHQIDDYIQGTPVNAGPALMAASMMGQAAPLQFTNTNARLYGIDLTAEYQFNPRWSLDLLGQYVAGEERDSHDDLYRIAPPKLVLGVNYQTQAWFARIEALAVGKQNKVSNISNEQATSGYALVNLSLGYEVNDWQLKAGVNNLLDTDYEDHLGAYNRVMMSQLSVGERMPGLGINAWLSGEYRF